MSSFSSRGYVEASTSFLFRYGGILFCCCSRFPPKPVVSLIVPLNVTSLAFREIGCFMKCLPLQQYAMTGRFLLLVYAL